MSVLPPSCSAIASGRPPPRLRPLAARVRPPILPSTVSRRRWRRAAARLSRAPHSARRCAGQAAGGPTHRPPRQSPTHSCALCLTAAGRAAVITARLVLHSPCWLALRPELSPLSHLGPRLFPPGLTPRTSDRSPWYPPHPPVLLAPAGWRPLLRPEALHRSGASPPDPPRALDRVSGLRRPCRTLIRRDTTPLTSGRCQWVSRDTSCRATLLQRVPTGHTGMPFSRPGSR